MNPSYDIRSVEYLGGYRLRLSFADGAVGELDLSSKFEGSVGSIFEPLRDQDFFAKVRVDPELGTITWPNGADLAPEVFHNQPVRVA